MTRSTSRIAPVTPEPSGEQEPDAVQGRLADRSPFWLGFAAALGVLTAYGLVHVLLQLSELLAYLVLSLFLALGLEPIVLFLGRRGVRRSRAVPLVVLGVALLLALVGWVVLPVVVDQVVELVNRAPAYLTQVQNSRLVEWLDARWHIGQRLEDRVRTGLNEQTVTALFGGVLGVGVAVVNRLIGAVTVLVLTLYLMATMPRAKEAAYRSVPHSRRPGVERLGEEMSRRVGGYLLGQSTVAVINGLLSYLVLLVLHAPFPAVLAVVVGLLALVPIVGTLGGGVLVTLATLTVGWHEALIALGYYTAYHVFEAYVLAPRIMHRVVQVPAAIAIVAILAGGTLAGVLGALVAIPVAAGLHLLYDQVLVPRQQRS